MVATVLPNFRASTWLPPVPVVTMALSSMADCCSWMQEVGFHDTHVEHLDGPDSMAVGIKN